MNAAKRNDGITVEEHSADLGSLDVVGHLLISKLEILCRAHSGFNYVTKFDSENKGLLIFTNIPAGNPHTATRNIVLEYHGGRVAFGIGTLDSPPISYGLRHRVNPATSQNISIDDRLSNMLKAVPNTPNAFGYKVSRRSVPSPR